VTDTTTPRNPALIPAKPRDTASLIFLIAANAVPLLGVFLAGWDVRVIVLLYWAENLVIGFYTALKLILLPMPRPSAHLAKLFFVPFFCVHFGGFCAGHGFFLMIFLKVDTSLPTGLLWAVLSLFISHGFSFVQNYLLGGEFRHVTIGHVMGLPYARIVVLHVVIIASGFFIMLFGSPLPLLVLLILGKTVLDIFLHALMHARTRTLKPQPNHA